VLLTVSHTGAQEEAPPRHVPPPHKRACTGAAARAPAPPQQRVRSGPAAAAGLRTPADADADAASEGDSTVVRPAAASSAGVATGGSGVPERLLRRIEEHHAMLAPVLRHV
jgi:hypothetical protein